MSQDKNAAPKSAGKVEQPAAKPDVSAIKLKDLLRAEYEAAGEIAEHLIGENYTLATPERVLDVAGAIAQCRSWPELPYGDEGKRAEHLIAECRDKAAAGRGKYPPVFTGRREASSVMVYRDTKGKPIVGEPEDPLA